MTSTTAALAPPVPGTIASHIVAVATRHAIPISLLAAICAKESSFNPWAWNPEPAYRYLWDNARRAPFRALTTAERVSETPPADFTAAAGDKDQEWWGQQASWGLAQVMGAVAREHGFKGGYFPELCDPEVGLEYACRLLAKLLARYELPEALSAYNAGRPTSANWDKYVQPILRWESAYRVAGI